ncbi:hypothetical protein RJ639_036486, partial [Escallonia herrerae]
MISGMEKEEFLKEFGEHYGYPNGPKNIDEIRATEYCVLGPCWCNSVFRVADGSDFQRSRYSQSDSSSATCNIVEEARQQVLNFCKASPKEYKCIFTSGATAALKLVGEAFPWTSQSSFMYTMENHNSVLGIREYPSTLSIICNAFNLFAFPSECNFSGVRFNLDLVKTVKEEREKILEGSSHCKGCWMVLIDAAKGSTTALPDLSKYKADFVVISFHKLFGYPTGLGALIVHNGAAKLLKKTYFSGGTVAASIADIDFVKRRERTEEFLEDGTISFLSIASIHHGFKILNTLNSSAISWHTASLATYVRNMLLALRHDNGTHVCTIYGAHQSEHLLIVPDNLTWRRRRRGVFGHNPYLLLPRLQNGLEFVEDWRRGLLGHDDVVGHLMGVWHFRVRVLGIAIKRLLLFIWKKGACHVVVGYLGSFSISLSNMIRVVGIVSWDAKGAGDLGFASLTMRHVFLAFDFLWADDSRGKRNNDMGVGKVVLEATVMVSCNEMGPTVAFNLKRPDGSWFGYHEVEKLASLSGIQLRTGCFCNPGACAKYLGLSHLDILSNIEAGHVCWDDRDILNGKPTGAVRISFGYMSTFEDARKFMDFIVRSFVALPSLNGHMYPLTPRSIPVPTEGLTIRHLHVTLSVCFNDCYMIESGSQKQNWGNSYPKEGKLVVPEMGNISTLIDLNLGILFVQSPRCKEKLQIELKSGSFAGRDQMDIHSQSYLYSSFLQSLGGCNRCQMINMNPQAGVVQRSNEPLATLAAYRRVKGKIFFGVLLRCENSDKLEQDTGLWLEVGQEVYPSSDSLEIYTNYIEEKHV